VRTRTLILLAVGCGVAILAAGVAFFIRIATHKEELTVPDIKGPRQSQQVGDVTATVTSTSTVGGVFVVQVRLDASKAIPDAGEGWSLVVAGDTTPRSPVTVPSGTGTPCANTAVPAGGTLDCAVAFTNGSGDHYVAYAHDGVQRQWLV
jgi:hypothetical protein